MKMIFKIMKGTGRIVIASVLLSIGFVGYSQETIVDYLNQDEYVIGNITVSGVKYLDPNAIIGISGLRKYQRIDIPGENIIQAIDKLWKQGLFSDIRISITETRADTVFLDLYLSERPRISAVNYFGIKKNEIEDVSEKTHLLNGSQLTDHIIANTTKIIKDHFIEKGFLNTEVRIIQKDDPETNNMVILNIHVDKNDRVKIADLNFEGNEAFKDK